MLLSHNDITKIQHEGFLREYFVDESKGWLRLKNTKGHCVFHDGKQCTIYRIRPEGCRLYPLIYDMEYHLSIIDDICPFRDEIAFQSSDIERLQKLVQKLQAERNDRKKRRG